MEVYSYTYSIPYLIFLGYLFLLMFWEFHCINKNISTKYVHWAVIVGFLFFFGLRGWAYADWINYFQLFESIPSLLSEKFYNLELIFLGKGLYGNWGYNFVILNSISKTICDDYLFFQFLLSTIDIILLNILIRQHSPKYYVLPFILFTVFWGINLEINIIRNIKCILIFLLSIKYVEERKWFKYFLMMFIAYGFHYSAIILFPLYFIIPYRWSKNLVWVTFIIGFIIYFFQINWISYLLDISSSLLPNVVQDKITFYTSDEFNFNANLSLGFIERLTTLFIFFIPYDKWTNNNRKNLIFINLYIIYFLILLISSEYKELSGRVSVLFIASYWFLYPRIFTQFTKKYKILFLIVLLCISSLKVIIENNSYLYQYQNILFGIDTQEYRKQKILKTFYNENFN